MFPCTMQKVQAISTRVVSDKKFGGKNHEQRESNGEESDL